MSFDMRAVAAHGLVLVLVLVLVLELWSNGVLGHWNPCERIESNIPPLQYPGSALRSDSLRRLFEDEDENEDEDD